MSLKSRLRGVLGTAIVWGAAFSLLSPILIVGQWSIRHLPTHYLVPRIFLFVMGMQFMLGAAAGVLFALLMLLRERRQVMSTLSTLRVTTWGFLGSAMLVVPLSGFGVHAHTVAAMLTYGIMGAGLAAGTLLIARRAPTYEHLSAAELLQLRAGG